MEGAYKEMAFVTMRERLREAKALLASVANAIERQDACLAMAMATDAQKKCQLIAFHADHLLLLAEQEETILLAEIPDERTHSSGQTPRQPG
jgi:hypothetical protein